MQHHRAEGQKLFYNWSCPFLFFSSFFPTSFLFTSIGLLYIASLLQLITLAFDYLNNILLITILLLITHVFPMTNLAGILISRYIPNSIRVQNSLLLQLLLPIAVFFYQHYASNLAQHCTCSRKIFGLKSQSVIHSKNIQ